MRHTRSLSELWVADAREEWHLQSPLSWREMHDHGPDSMPLQSPFVGICSCVENIHIPGIDVVGGWRTGCGSHPPSAERVEDLEESVWSVVR